MKTPDAIGGTDAQQQEYAARALPDESCRCWTNSHALGHGGHCCFLTDDRKTWRSDDDAVCHGPGEDS